jgi:glycosyltransferase involved in cell wall biosynthesis
MVDLQKFKPPHVATKVGDIPEIIEHPKNGLLIEPGDSKSLAAAILEFISDEKLAALCAADGLRYAIKHFSFDDIDRGKASSRCFIDRHRDGKTAPCAQ